MYLAFTIFAAVALTFPPALTQQTLPITVIQGEPDTCPSDQEREEARQNITTYVRNILQGFETAPQCGEGVWRKVAFLNMSNPSQQCPSPWREYTSIRSCGTRSAACHSVTYAANSMPYSKVCGRSIGYSKTSPDAFHRFISQPFRTVDDNYVDGLSVTYGTPRNHIWTFAAGLHEPNEATPRFEWGYACPSACTGDSRFGTNPPSYVGNNYFCEAGHFDARFTNRHYSEPLWDGEGCNNSQCCSFNTPPWFSISLPTFTSDDIEVRLCHDQHTGDEDVTIELLEIYVQ